MANQTFHIVSIKVQIIKSDLAAGSYLSGPNHRCCRWLERLALLALVLLLSGLSSSRLGLRRVNPLRGSKVQEQLGSKLFQVFDLDGTDD